MIKIGEPKLTETILKENAHALYVVEPLERGYGTTIGNCLRRILCTALPGAAIIGVKIEGVRHEFSTIPGIKEDVTEIILNLKDIAVKVESEDTFETENVRLHRTEGGIVTAKDIELNMGIEIMNPDAYICTMEDGSELDMTLTIGTGRGYVPATENHTNLDHPIGYIPIDSLFSPVVKVSYAVEPTRVKQDINYDKLTLDVTTNAAASPRDVISLAAKIMNDHMKLFIDLIDGMKENDIFEKTGNTKENKTLNMNIEELELSVRPLNCLKRASISTVEDLIKLSEDDLLRVRNLGRKSIDEIIVKLRNMGLELCNKDE